MGFTKISNLSLTDLFVQQVENMILSGELQVGEKLPPERELAIRMGVSRPVISAGLIELEKLGFVEILPRQGAYICDYRRKGTVETLVAIMRYNSGTMRKTEVKSLLEVREQLECLCSRLVIENASDEELQALEGILDELKGAKDVDIAADETGAVRPIAGGAAGMKLFKQHQKLQRRRRWAAAWFKRLEKLFFWRITLREKTSFGDETCYYYRNQAIARRTGSGAVVYNSWRNRLRFRVPEDGGNGQ